MDTEIAVISLIRLITDPANLALMLLAVPMGMLFGVIPGLGGKLAVMLSIPLAMGLDKTQGAVFLLSMHAVVHTSGSIPSLLFGIPGTGPAAATIVDGYPLA